MGGVDQLHEGLALRTEAAGGFANDAFGGALRALYQEGFLTLQRGAIGADGIQLGLERVPADIAGDVFFAGFVQQIVLLGVLFVSARGPSMAVGGQRLPGLAVVEKEDESAPILRE